MAMVAPDPDALARSWTRGVPPPWQGVLRAWALAHPDGTEHDIRRLYTGVRRRMAALGADADTQRHWKRAAQHMVRALRAGGLEVKI